MSWGDTQQRRQTLLVISVQQRCPQDRGEGNHAETSPLLPCWAFEGGAWLGPVPPAPPQTLGMESPGLALLLAPHVISSV